MPVEMMENGGPYPTRVETLIGKFGTFTKNPYIDEYGTRVIVSMLETLPLKNVADLLCILEED
jgi:hypothetical protein